MKKVLIISLLLVSNICIFAPLKSEEIVEDINLNEAKKLAPNINQDFISIKSLKTNDNSMAIFGILNFQNNLIMVPLKILNTW